MLPKYTWLKLFHGRRGGLVVDFVERGLGNQEPGGSYFEPAEPGLVDPDADPVSVGAGPIDWCAARGSGLRADEVQLDGAHCRGTRRPAVDPG